MIAETTVSSISTDAAPAKPAGPAGGGSVHLVSFRLGRQLYALPLDHVERALRMVAITPVPDAPPWAPGVVDLHGRVIPAVDLRQRFDQPPKEPALDDRLLIVQTKEQTVALMVDEVTGVVEAPAHQIEPATDPLSQSRPLAAAIRCEEELILVLNAARLLPSEEDVRRWEQEGLETQARIPKRPSIQETIQLQEDDLTEIKGIGKVYADKLVAGGVRTFGALTEIAADELVALLHLPESRLSNVQGWIDQAAELMA